LKSEKPYEMEGCRKIFGEKGKEWLKKYRKMKFALDKLKCHLYL